MQQAFLVFLGGGLGSVFRYLVSILMRRIAFNFPWATLSVNIIGCFLIGVILAFAEKYRVNANWVLLLTTGFCGGFTTFSSFAYENQILLKTHSYFYFVVYLLSSIVVGVMAVFLGMFVVRYR